MEQNLVNSSPVVRSSRWPLRILSIVWGLLAFPAVFMAMMSGMVFDAPGSDNSFLTQLLFWSIFTTPLVLLVSCIGGLIVSFRKSANQNPWTGRVLAVIPLVNVAVVILAWVLIDAICNGEFVC